MFKQGLRSQHHQKSPSPRQKKYRPHNSSPLKSLENRDRSNVGNDMTTVCSMVGQQPAEDDGLVVQIQKNFVFADSYDIQSEIGRGKFAVVKKCQHKTTGVDFAAKFQRKRRKGKDCRCEIIQEVKMLELDHPQLVELVEVFETSHELIIITEYAAGGELFRHIMVDEGFEEKEVIRLLRQILTGLLYLHERDIVHLDVKPQNILLTSDPPHGDVKLCDFGFARTIKSKDEVRDIIGTPDYVAPEVLSYEPLHTSCDMWSVGVLAYVMLTGCSPFAGDNKMETFSNITQLNYDFPDELFENISQHAIDFMKKLLKKEPGDRMTALQSLKHPWLYDEKQKLAHPISPTKSPFGSPLGCRRTLTPSPGEVLETEEPMKKCKCTTDSSGDELDRDEEEETVKERNLGVAFGPSDSDQCMGSSTDDLDDILSSNEMLDECVDSPSAVNFQNEDNNLGDNCVVEQSCNNSVSVNNEEEVLLSSHVCNPFISLPVVNHCDVISQPITSSPNSVCDNIEFIKNKDCDNNKHDQNLFVMDNHDKHYQHLTKLEVDNTTYFTYNSLSENVILKTDIQQFSENDERCNVNFEDIDERSHMIKVNQNSKHGESNNSCHPVMSSDDEISQNYSQNNCLDLVNGNDGSVDDNRSNVITLFEESDSHDLNETDC